MFDEMIDFYRKKDKDTWEKIRKALKDAGVRHVRAGHYFGDAVSPNGIGGQLDPRNFGPAGRIDRDIYYIRIRKADEEAARNAIRSHGLTAQVVDYRASNEQND